MLANFFGKSKPINAVLITILFFVAYTLLVLNAKTTFDWTLIPWFLFLFGLVNFVVSKNKLTKDNSYFFLSFVVLLGLFHSAISINDTFYAFVCIVQFYRKTYSLQNQKNILKKTFDAGLWLGIAFVFEPITFLLGLVFLLSLFSYNKLNLRGLLVFLLGFMVPLVLYFTYCFWFDLTSNFISLFDFYAYLNFDFSYGLVTSSLLFSIGLLVFVVILVKSPRILSVINTFRVSWILTLIMFPLSVLLCILTHSFVWIVFPCALILANGLEHIQHKKIASFFIFLFVFNVLLISFL